MFIAGLRKWKIKCTYVLLFVCSILYKILKLQTEVVHFFYSFELDFISNAKFLHSFINFIIRFFIDKVEIITQHFCIRDELTPRA